MGGSDGIEKGGRNWPLGWVATVSQHTRNRKMGRKCLSQVGDGLLGGDALDIAVGAADDDVLAAKGFLFEHAALCKVEAVLQFLAKFCYFFI